MLDQWKIIYFILLCLVVLAGCGEEEQPVSDIADIEQDTLDVIQDTPGIHIGIQRFTVSIQEDEVGIMQLEVSPSGDDSLLISQTINWEMPMMGSIREVQMEMTAVTDRSYDLGRMEMLMSDGSADISVSAVRRDSLLLTSIVTAGRVIENETIVEGDYLPVLADLASASMEWEEGQERTFQSFDPASGAILSATAICQGFEMIPLLGDTVEAAKLQLSQMGNTVWVLHGQIVREYKGGLGMEMVRIPLVEEVSETIETPVQAVDENLVSTSDVWYASELRSLFPSGIEIDHWEYDLAELPCYPEDITTFDIYETGTINQAGVQGFGLSGTLSVGAIESPFRAYDGEYMLKLQAYLVSPNGQVVWTQNGYLRGAAWVSDQGQRGEFVLISSHSGATSGHKLVVVALGDPIYSEHDEGVALLGAKIIQL